ncbi:hypothetical protein [Flavobacterium psychrotrophum]|uniref:hypothetical protein n=1 Tax=Flavobacterium psychrotrophum TaxID=2294119 RepID=UPI000E323A61|nr:hypothetical protein [Flavobacterium psychrotrophum]
MKPISNKYTRSLLPNYFKKIGIGVVASSIIALLSAKPFISDASEEIKDFAFLAILNFIILGIFLFAWSANKIEDEMTLQIRLKAVLASFIFIIAYAFMYPFISFFIFGDNDFELSIQQAILTMLIVFIMTHRMMLKGMNNEK